MPVVLLSGARAPVCLDLARAFDALGWGVQLVDFQRFPLARFSSCCKAYWRLPAPTHSADFPAAFRGLVDRLSPDLIVPTCEEIFWLRQSFAGETLCCPELSQLLEVHDKFSFVSLCQGLGLAVPDSFQVRTWSEFQRTSLERPWCSVDIRGRFSVVLKPAFSRFGYQQKLRPTTAEIQAVLNGSRAWVCQSFVEGQGYCSYSVAQGGKLVAHVCYRPLLRLNHGAAVAIEAVEHPEILEWTRKFVAATGWSGQIAFDFIQPEGGQAMAIECNPRSTSGIHLFRGGLATELALALTRLPREADSVLSPLTGTCAHLEFPALVAWATELPKSLSRLGLLNRSHPVIFSPQDLMPWLGQALGFGELWLNAIWSGRGLLAQSTFDIEWNGNLE